jgi:hypothetical protein
MIMYKVHGFFLAFKLKNGYFRYVKLK